MYNIAFTGVMLIVLFLAVDIEQDGKRMLQAIGVFWATVISSAAFVVPRLMQANSTSHGETRSRVSGLDLSDLENVSGFVHNKEACLSDTLRASDNDGP